MAPPDKTLEADLKKVVRQLFKDDDNLTVNSVRDRVTKMHGLEEGFFTNAHWKDRSKMIIKTLAGKLADGNDSEEDEAVSDVDDALGKPKTKKRSSPSADPPAAKRQKKAAPVKSKPAPKKKAPAKKKKAVSDSDLSDMSESEADASMSEPEASMSEDDSEEEAPKPTKGAKEADKKSSESELSDLESSEEEKPKKKMAARPKPRAKPKTKSRVVASESELSEPEEEKAEEVEAKDSIESKAGEGHSGTKLKDEINSDSELSSVIDEPPPKKRGKAGPPKSGSAKAPAAKELKQLSADEEEIKKLQGQLVKCGIRKIWGIELKQYGDDAKAKIRHLRGMLADAGMTGRFSEARAKEIKEQRELMADLEAVTDMNALWGSRAASGRSSRSKAPKKSLKEDTDSDDEEGGVDKGGDDDEGADEEETQAQARVSRRQADLAFLDDESDSD